MAARKEWEAWLAEASRQRDEARMEVVDLRFKLADARKLIVHLRSMNEQYRSQSIQDGITIGKLRRALKETALLCEECGLESNPLTTAIHRLARKALEEEEEEG